MIIKPECLMSASTQYGQMNGPSRCSQHLALCMFGESPRKPVVVNGWFQL